MQWMVKLVHLLLCCGFIIIIIHESVCLDLSQNLAMKKESHGKKKNMWLVLCMWLQPFPSFSLLFWLCKKKQKKTGKCEYVSVLCQFSKTTILSNCTEKWNYGNAKSLRGAKWQIFAVIWCLKKCVSVICLNVSIWP